MVTNNHNHNRRRFILGLVLTVVSTTLLLSLELHFKPFAENGIYFQHWSSEKMMRNVSIEDLRDQPLRTLLYLHIQPPAYDGIRALLAFIWRSEESMIMLQNVDNSIYILWAIFYGILGFVVFWWLSDITNNLFALSSSVIFLLHPAVIFYATLLDTTLISAVFILFFFYLLWRVGAGMGVSAAVLALSFLTLYFTRSIFQWPWLLILPASLALLGFPFRNLALFVLITGLIIGLYSAKQVRLFHINSSSSFTGFNLCQSIGYSVNYESYAENFISKPEPGLENIRVLTRIKKPNGSVNFNNIQYLAINQKLIQKYRRRVLQTPPRLLARIFTENLRIYLLPSSQYTKHVIVDQLPQRSVYDRVFSSPILPVLLAIAALFWLIQSSKTDLPAAIGLLVPVAIIAFISIFCERGENMRFKFFIEPVLFVFIVVQGFHAGKKITKFVASRVTSANPKEKCGKVVY